MTESLVFLPRSTSMEDEDEERAMLEFLKSFPTLSVGIPDNLQELDNGIALFEAMHEISPDYFNPSSIVRRGLDRVPYFKLANVKTFLKSFQQYLLGDRGQSVDLQAAIFHQQLPSPISAHEDLSYQPLSRTQLENLLQLVVAAAFTCPHKGVYEMRLLRYSGKVQVLMTRIIQESVQALHNILSISHSEPSKNNAPSHFFPDSPLQAQISPQSTTLPQYASPSPQQIKSPSNMLQSDSDIDDDDYGPVKTRRIAQSSPFKYSTEEKQHGRIKRKVTTPPIMDAPTALSTPVLANRTTKLRTSHSHNLYMPLMNEKTNSLPRESSRGSPLIDAIEDENDVIHTFTDSDDEDNYHDHHNDKVECNGNDEVGTEGSFFLLKNEIDRKLAELRFLEMGHKSRQGSKQTSFNHPKNRGHFVMETGTFVIPDSSTNPVEITDYLQVPEFEISGTADLPTKIRIRKRAVKSIQVSHLQFHLRKSFWTIVPKIPSKATSIMFANRQGQLLDFDSPDGTYDGRYDNETDRYNLNGLQPQFYTTRVQHSIVFVRRRENDDYTSFYLENLPQIELPEKYDLLINPWFFHGDNYYDEVCCKNALHIWKGDSLFGSTLAQGLERGFFYVFGRHWKTFVCKVETRCMDGRESGVQWPQLLEGQSPPIGLAPSYFEIPDGYGTFAAGLLLGMYKDVGVREIWAAGGLKGIYNFAHSLNHSATQRENALVFAMLREAIYGCRSAKLGVKLLHCIDLKYHDDFIPFCTFPWSKIENFEAKMENNEPHALCSFGSLFNRGQELKHANTERLLDARTSSHNFSSTELNGTRVASRYLVSAVSSQHRGTMNFLGAVGLEMLGLPYPTLQDGHIHVVSDFFEDHNEAKSELLDFSTKEKLLPGAALMAAAFEEKSEGVLNVTRARTITNGHIAWMREYNIVGSIIFLAAVVTASCLGWLQSTGVYHLLVAVVFLTGIAGKHSIVGSLSVLILGKSHGHRLHQEKMVDAIIPVALVSVLAAFELTKDQRVARIVLICSSSLVCFIILITMMARWRFQHTLGQSVKDVLMRDGGMECLLSSEHETGFRGTDRLDIVGVGPVQAQLFNRAEFNGEELASSTIAAPYHVSKHWVIAGKVQQGHESQWAGTNNTTTGGGRVVSRLQRLRNRMWSHSTPSSSTTIDKIV